MSDNTKDKYLNKQLFEYLKKWDGEWNRTSFHLCGASSSDCEIYHTVKKLMKLLEVCPNAPCKDPDENLTRKEWLIWCCTLLEKCV